MALQETTNTDGLLLCQYVKASSGELSFHILARKACHTFLTSGHFLRIF